MKNSRNLILPLVALLGLCGCVTTERYVQTTTGRPEVVVNTTDVDFLRSQLVDSMVNAGYAITDESRYSLSFIRTLEGMESVFTQMVIGNSYSTTPEMVIRYNFAERGESVRIVAFASVQTQMAFGQTRQQDLSQNVNVTNDLQGILEVVKMRGEGKNARMGFFWDEKFSVNNLHPGGPAENAGVQIGDIAISVDGKKISDMNPIESVKSFWGEPGSVSTLQVERNGEILSFDVKREIID